MKDIQRGVDRCKRHYYGYYEDICRHKTENRDGSRRKPDLRCRQVWTPAGKPAEVCTDISIPKCVRGYERDWPSISKETHQDLDVAAHFGGVVEASGAAGQNITLTWPSGTGYASMCELAGRTASTTCLNTKTACKRGIRRCR